MDDKQEVLRLLRLLQIRMFHVARIRNSSSFLFPENDEKQNSLIHLETEIKECTSSETLSFRHPYFFFATLSVATSLASRNNVVDQSKSDHET